MHVLLVLQVLLLSPKESRNAHYKHHNKIFQINYCGFFDEFSSFGMFYR